MKASVSKPSHGWGTVKPGDIGTVTALDGSGGCTIKFPRQSGWSGKVSEIETIGPSGPVTDINKAIGLRVKRGPDWKWGTQDKSGVGTINKLDSTGWVGVKWDHGGTNSYRTTHRDLVFFGAAAVATTVGGAAATTAAFTSSTGSAVIGSKVRVKLSVSKPQFGWGSVKSGDIGTVTAVTKSKLTVDFPRQKSWKGACSEMEVVVVAGPGTILSHTNASVGLRVHTVKSHSGKTGDATLLGWKYRGTRTGDTSGGLNSDGYCRLDFDKGGPYNVSLSMMLCLRVFSAA